MPDTLPELVGFNSEVVHYLCEALGLIAEECFLRTGSLARPYLVQQLWLGGGWGLRFSSSGSREGGGHSTADTGHCGL